MENKIEKKCEPFKKKPASAAVQTVYTTDERVQIDWQWPLSGVHSMEKSAQPGEGGGCTPSPFSIFTITSKDEMWCNIRSSLEGTLPISPLPFSPVWCLRSVNCTCKIVHFLFLYISTV